MGERVNIPLTGAAFKYVRLCWRVSRVLNLSELSFEFSFMFLEVHLDLSNLFLVRIRILELINSCKLTS